MLKSRGKSKNYIAQIILFGWLILLIGACNQTIPATSKTTHPTEPVQATNTQGVVTAMNPSATPFASGLENLIEQVKADLAKRLAIPGTQVNLVEATEVEWSDSSLGCPQPEMSYLQVITPGYLILLDVNGTRYEYHSNRETYFVYCENPNPLILPPKP